MWISTLIESVDVINLVLSELFKYYPIHPCDHHLENRMETRV